MRQRLLQPIVEQLMKQRGLNVSPAVELIKEQVAFPAVHDAGNAIACGCSRSHPLRAGPNQHRGLMGKLADAVFYLISGRRRGDTFLDRLRD